MADNIAITAGVGTTVKTDDVAGVHYQQVKLVDGTLEATAVIAADVGVKANALRVAPASDITDATYIGDIKFGEALPAGTAAIGKLAANSGVDIGDVDVLSIAAGTSLIGKVSIDQVTANANEVVVKSITAGDTNIGNVDIVTVPAPLSVVGTGTEAAAMRVTIATDSTGVLSVDDNGGALTVDGTVAVTNAGITSIDGKITACNTGAVVLAAGTALAGKVGIDQATANANEVVVKSGTVTAVTAITNAVAVTNAPLTSIDGKMVTGTVIGDVNLGATDNAVLDSIVTNTNRAAITGYGQAKLDHADVTTAQVLVAAVADKKFYMTSITLSVAAAGSYWIEDDDAAQITCKWTLAANGGLVWTAPIDTPWKSTTVNKGLKVKGSAAGVIGCMITYYTLA